MGEQGAESIHSAFNSIERSYLCMPNKVERLLSIMKEHHIRTDPQNISMVPTTKKRKRKQNAAVEE